jgi:tetratricopeptide (TPR) repeat protein
MGGFVLLALVVGGVLWFNGQQAARKKADASYTQALDYGHEGESAKALKAINKAIGYQESAKAYFYKFRVHKIRSERYAAELALKDAVRLENNNTDYLMEAANFLDAINKEPDTVRAYLKKITTASPTNSYYQMRRGDILSRQGDEATSTAVLEDLVANDPGYEDGWITLGNAYTNFNQPDKAVDLWQRATQQFKNDPYYWYQLGVTLEHFDRKKEAVPAFQKAIDVSPNTGTAAAAHIAKITGKKPPERYRVVLEDTLPITMVGNHAIVKATLEKADGRFLIDTGAEISIVHQDFIDKMGIGMPDHPRLISIQGVVGRRSVPIVVGDFKLGRYDLKNIRLAVLPASKTGQQNNPASHDGIIGMNVLRQFDMTFKPNRREIVLSRQ